MVKSYRHVRVAQAISRKYQKGTSFFLRISQYTKMTLTGNSKMTTNTKRKAKTE